MPENVAVRSPTYPNLAGLDVLARQNDVDIRPILVRVLTDLYVQNPAHTAEEERHYVELVLRLVDLVDVSTRSIVAQKLANYPAAPAAVIRRLARDVIAPIGRHSSRLTRRELPKIIREFRQAAAIAVAEIKQIRARAAALCAGRQRSLVQNSAAANSSRNHAMRQSLRSIEPPPRENRSAHCDPPQLLERPLERQTAGSATGSVSAMPLR